MQTKVEVALHRKQEDRATLELTKFSSECTQTLLVPENLIASFFRTWCSPQLHPQRMIIENFEEDSRFLWQYQQEFSTPCLGMGNTRQLLGQIPFLPHQRKHAIAFVQTLPRRQPQLAVECFATPCNAVRVLIHSASIVAKATISIIKN